MGRVPLRKIAFIEVVFVGTKQAIWKTMSLEQWIKVFLLKQSYYLDMNMYLLSIFIQGLLHPHRIDIFEDYIYGAGPKNGAFRVHKFGRSLVEYLSVDVDKAKSALIFHRYKQMDCE